MWLLAKIIQSSCMLRLPVPDVDYQSEGVPWYILVSQFARTLELWAGITAASALYFFFPSAIKAPRSRVQ